MASKLARGLKRLLVAADVPRIARFLHRESGLILAYHNVMPPGEEPVGDRSLHMRWVEFTQQISHLEDSYEIVPVEALLRLEPRPTGGRPRVALTFDDAYTGAVTHAIPFLVSRGHPATIFVAPGCLGSGGYWWDRLARPVDEGGLSPEIRAFALGELGGQGARVEGWANEVGHPLRDLPLHAQPARRDQLDDAAAERGIRLASHSWSHANLRELPSAKLTSELERSLTWLRDRYSNAKPWIAYPYGFSGSEPRAAAHETGYVAGFEIAGGRIGPRAKPPKYRVPRLNVPAGTGHSGFALRISGLVTG